MNTLSYWIPPRHKGTRLGILSLLCSVSGVVLAVIEDRTHIFSVSDLVKVDAFLLLGVIAALGSLAVTNGRSATGWIGLFFNGLALSVSVLILIVL